MVFHLLPFTVQSFPCFLGWFSIGFLLFLVSIGLGLIKIFFFLPVNTFKINRLLPSFLDSFLLFERQIEFGPYSLFRFTQEK